MLTSSAELCTSGVPRHRPGWTLDATNRRMVYRPFAFGFGYSLYRPQATIRGPIRAARRRSFDVAGKYPQRARKASRMACQEARKTGPAAPSAGHAKWVGRSMCPPP